MPVDLAIEMGLSLRRRVTTEVVCLHDAPGRILARTLVARDPQPRFDHSAMDGYAVNVDDIGNSPLVRLNLVGRIPASRTKEEIFLNAGTAVRILTGAPIPPSANSVIVQEEVRREGNAVLLSRIPGRGENIRLRGEDVQVGDLLIESGSLMEPRALAIAASAGEARIELFRKIRVAIFSTGSELRQPDETLSPGEIYNSNRYLMLGLLNQPWIDPIDLGSCRDDAEALGIYMREAVAKADVIITTGGVSVGEEDHMADVVRNCGGTIVVNGVAIKPGKPLKLGNVGDVAYIGLPGNPGAAFTTFHVVVNGLLQAWAGLKPRAYYPRPMVSDFSWTCRIGRSTYLPAIIKGYDAN